MEQVAAIEGRSLLRQRGATLLISCYELGHQPIGIAQPMGFLEQAGFAPVGLDIAVENIDESPLRLARFIGISVPMHTALRLGVRVAELIRTMNQDCHICFYDSTPRSMRNICSKSWPILWWAESLRSRWCHSSKLSIEGSQSTFSKG